MQENITLLFLKFEINLMQTKS